MSTDPTTMRHDPNRYFAFAVMVLGLICSYQMAWLMHYREKIEEMKTSSLVEDRVYEMLVVGPSRPPRSNWYIKKCSTAPFFTGHRSRAEAENYRPGPFDLVEE